MDEVLAAARRVDLANVIAAVDFLEETYVEDRSVFTMGNGGFSSRGRSLQGGDS